MLDLVTGRESDCAKWLDAGTVTGALTHHASDVAGYDRINLGLAAYVAVASPDFLRSHPLPDTFRSALCLKLGTDDFLPDLWSKAVGWEPAQRAHFFPSTSAIVEGARLGLGWAVVRQSSVADDLAAGRLRSLAGHTLRQPLFWHCRISVRSALARFEIELRRKAETLLTDGSSGQVTGENYNFALK